MKHYDYLSIYEKESIFYLPPSNIRRSDDKEIISHSLGALLYMPATRVNIADDIVERRYAGLKSIALCLEVSCLENSFIM